MPTFNVAVQVVDLIDAATEADAIAALTERVTKAGLDVLETSGSAFESEDSEDEQPTYKIRRFYQGDYDTETIETGLSYEDAKDHCNDPESSSRTTTNAAGLALTRERGEWFDGFERE